MTEVWFRNPTNYIRELVEEAQTNIAWDRGLLVKRRMDPMAHAQLYFGQEMPFRLLLVGEQGTAELRLGHPLEKPYAVYPTWQYEDSTAILEELVTQPVGEDRSVCEPGKAAPDETPVFGQEHRIVITGSPAVNQPPGRRFIAFLKELQEDYPDVILHLHGIYSWRVAFGTGLAATDIDGRIEASKGKIVLPTGRIMPHEQAARNPKWITVLGFNPVDLKEPRNRCRYNIRSAVWAGENFVRVMTLPTARATVDPDAVSPEPPKGGKIYPRAPKEPGDKFVCNTCSVMDNCVYFRDGAVCAVPGSEPVQLSQYFKTRNSALILEGLGVLMAVQTRRLEQGLEEEEYEGIKPEITKIIKDLFQNGVTLAKLVDPGLRDPKLAIHVGPGGTAAVINGTPAQAVSAVIRALEVKGIKREEITPSMVENLLEAMTRDADPQRVIEGTVIADRDEKAV